MWRTITRQVSLRTSQGFSSFKPHPSICTSFLGFSETGISDKLKKSRPSELSSHPKYGLLALSFGRMAEILPQNEVFGRPNCSLYGASKKCYASVAEAVVMSSTDGEEAVSADEVQELLQEMGKQEKKTFGNWRRRQQSVDRGMGSSKYHRLRRRQVKIETEAWDQAAKEYKDLLKDMCEHKLAPNLPYMKSLFLGWFEPLNNEITKDQELCRQGKNRASYAPYFDQLPADMMSVITMHKMMALLMTGGGHGCARVVQAACTIGEAIEQEVG